VKLKPLVFFPPFLCFALSLLQAFGGGRDFFEKLNILQNWVLSHLDSFFTAGTFSLLVVCIIAFVSPLGGVRIGGPQAKPFLDKWRWFAITLCTTVAVGAVFWGAAEPILHFHEPSGSLKGASEEDRILFAISSLYLHWSLTPYAIYTVPALVFALTYYNLKRPFSLSAPLSPIFGDRLNGKKGEIIDSICLFSLVAGMSSSLGTGVLTISGGVSELLGVSYSIWLLSAILFLVVLAFVMAAVTGVTRGIKLMSEINLSVFTVLAIFILCIGPTLFIFKTGYESLGRYFIEFIPRSFHSEFEGNIDPWTKSWTLFYWCNWLAWAPVTTLFLGRISYGYTVREAIMTNLVFPSIFAWIWMAIFGGWAINTDIVTDGKIFNLIQSAGVEKALYSLIAHLSIPTWLKSGTIFLVVLTAFLAYVTSAEANTSAMAAMSTKGISPENPEAPTSIKVIWGICVGLTAGVMVSQNGIEGVKTLSILGGVPSLFLIMLILGSLVKLVALSISKKI
jgi:choline-glycine betaine transporter